MARSLSARSVTIASACAISLFVLTRTVAASGRATPDRREIAVAQLQLPQLPQLPPLGGAVADWQQFDSFFTFVVRSLGQDLSGDLRDALAEAFLDARYELANVVAALRAGQNPVPQLFVNGWQRLSPIMNNALSTLPQQSQDEYRSFIAAADQLVALAQPGSQLGLLQISPDVLRGMAQLLEPAASGDPVSYNLGVDNALRSLLGLGAPISPPPPGTKQSRLPRLPLPLFNVEQASVASALAAEPDLKKLNSWLPEESDLEAYLLAVRGLLSTLSEQVAGKSKLAEEHKRL